MSDSPDTRPSLAGQRFAGRYELERRLGTGTAGDTYRAKHVEQERGVVVKVLHEDLGGDALRTRRFEWEAATLAGLSHPNTPAILDFGVFEGRRYVVREWLEGESLAERLQPGPLPLEAALSIGRQLLAALASAHAAKLVHRNIRPSNVFIERRKHGRERIKLLDFTPLSRPSEAGNAHPPSVAYPPPEVRAGEALDAQSDVYAVGQLMRAMLSDLPVPAIEAPNAPAPPPAAATRGSPRLPPDSALESWLDRATAERRSQRFSDAGQMLRELIDILPRNLRAQAEAQARAPQRARAPLPFAIGPAPQATSTELRFEPPAEPALPVAQKPLLVTPAMFTRATTSLPEASPIAVEGRGEPGTSQLTAATAIVASVVAAVVIFVMPSEHGQASRDAARVARLRAAPAKPAPIETKQRATTKPQLPVPIPLSATRIEGEVAGSAAAPAVSGAPMPAQRSLLPATKPGTARDPWLEPLPEELKGIPEIAASGAPGDESVLRRLRIYNTLHPNDARSLLLLARLYLNRAWRTDGVAQYAAALQRDRSARGAPEILPALLNVVAEGRAASDAEALIERVYGSDAIPAIDRALEQVKTPLAVARLSALSARLITRPGSPASPKLVPGLPRERSEPREGVGP